jgi:hypothetical protein
MIMLLAGTLLMAQDFTLDQYVRPPSDPSGRQSEPVPVEPGSTLKEKHITLRVQAKLDAPFIVEFEAKPQSLPFDGKGTDRSSDGTGPHSRLLNFKPQKPGPYHWRARIVLGKDVTPWKVFADPAFIAPGSIRPLFFRPLRPATKEELTKASLAVEQRLKSLKMSGLEVSVFEEDPDGIARLKVIPRDPYYDQEPVVTDLREIVSHPGIFFWAVTRTLTLAESTKFGLLGDDAPECLWAFHHDFGHRNTWEPGRYEKPVFVCRKTGLNPQDITFAPSSNGLSWKFSKGTADKLKKLPQDSNLYAILDGFVFTVGDTRGITMAAAEKRDPFIPASPSDPWHSIFLTVLKNPMPVGFMDEDIRKKREEYAAKILNSLDKGNPPQEEDLVLLLRILADTDTVRSNKETIDKFRKVYFSK